MTGFNPEDLVPSLAGFRDTRRCWIAFSGGLDSSVLLNALSSIRGQLPFDICAVHVNHGLHPECMAWSDYCARQCEGLGVPLTLRNVDVHPEPGESLEAFARDRRYAALAALMESRDLLLTAQHQDDQAETLLLALLRGSGVHGLAGMARLAKLGRGHLLRPLLGYSRDALVAYAHAEGLVWIDDPSNAELSFDRNLLRHRVLPLLRERWPSAQRTLARSASHCGEAAHLVDRYAALRMESVLGPTPRTLRASGLLGLERLVAKAVLRFWINDLGFLAPPARHLDRILDEMLPATQDAAPLVAWLGCEVRRYRDRLFAIRPLPMAPEDAAVGWCGGRLELPSGLGHLSMACHDAPDAELQVRFRVSGLDCRPGPAASRKSLKKVFQEAGVPPWLRPYVPLVFCGDELVAVAGVCACEVPGGAAKWPKVRWAGHPWQPLGIFKDTSCEVSADR